LPGMLLSLAFHIWVISLPWCFPPLVVPHPHQYSVLSVFGYLVIFIVALILIPLWYLMLKIFSYAYLRSLGLLHLGDWVQFLIGLFVSLWLSFKNSWCNLDSSPLSDEPFKNIFSQFVACLLILLTCIL
jgi:hypothetical protein